MTLPLFASIALLLTGCGGQVEDTRPGQPVKTRQAAFKEMLRAFEPMGTMLRTKRYDAEKFAALATGFMARREAPWTLFAADTHYPPTKAKAEVWSQPEEFERERQSFLAASAKLAEAARGKNLEEVEPAYFAVYDTCQTCHKRFKER